MTCNARRKNLRTAPQLPTRPYVQTRVIGPQRWVVGMTVALRRQPRVRQTLESLSLAGFDDVILFSEPDANDLPEPCEHITILKNDKVLGNWGNFCQRARTLVDFSAGTRYLLVQDDVDFLPGTREWVENNWPCNNGPSSLYRSSAYAPEEGAWSVVKPRGPFLGMLALVLTRGHLESLVANLDAMSDGENKKDDYKFGYYCHGLGIPINIANASRCQHTGECSSLYAAKMSRLRMAETYVE